MKLEDEGSQKCVACETGSDMLRYEASSDVATAAQRGQRVADYYLDILRYGVNRIQKQ
jgi:hypothetical protein